MDNDVFLSQVIEYAGILSLYLNGKEADKYQIDNSKLAFFVKLSERHSLRALFYLAISKIKIDVEPSVLRALESYYYFILRRDLLFEKERKEIEQFLSKNNIDYLLLKGLVLKHYYPDIHSREYADNDILFFGNEEIIKRFFVDRGYVAEYYKENNHDVYIKKPFFNFEMHRALFNESIAEQKNAEYFKDYLKKAHNKSGNEYYLSNEDFYIYFTAHTYKHFHNSGCGIRTLIDYYLFLKKNKLDFAYIDEELAKLELVNFSNLISSLSLKLFDKRQLNSSEKEALMYIASSGTYGTLANSVKKGIGEKGKMRYFFSRVFPPISFYKSAYPWAYKSKVLIPVAWAFSFIKRLFRNPKRAKAELALLSKRKNNNPQ